MKRLTREQLLARAAAVRLVVFDCDGVFTDGKLYIGDDGRETKAFNVQDGLGVKRLIEAGIEVAVISGRRSEAVRVRMRELGVAHLVEGADDKLAALRGVQRALGIEDAATACVGDDLPDHAPLSVAGLAIVVANAVPALDAVAHWRTGASGGAGAVREICELLLAARAVH